MHVTRVGMPINLNLIWSTFYLFLCVYLTWQWVRWIEPVESSKWRARTAVAGLCFATFSTILSVFLFVHASYTGGYPFYHPVELFCIRFGFLTALLGLVASITGRGKIGLHVALISTLNLLLWFWDAILQ